MLITLGRSSHHCRLLSSYFFPSPLNFRSTLPGIVQLLRLRQVSFLLEIKPCGMKIFPNFVPLDLN